MTHIPRVVITGITLGGQDVVDILDRDPNYVTIYQVVDGLPYSLTEAQKVILRTEAIQVLNERRNSK